MHESSARDLALHHMLRDRYGVSAPLARLALRVYHGCSNQQISATYNLPLGTVKSRMSRLYRALNVPNRSTLALTVMRLAGATATEPATEPEPALSDHRLSPRETRVAAQVARGHTNAEIARALDLSEGYVRVLTSTIYEKTGARNRLELTIRSTFEDTRALPA